MRTHYQRLHLGWIARCTTVAVIVTICASSVSSQSTGQHSIGMQVLDQQGGAISGARAAIIDAAGHETSGVTNQEGRFVFSNVTAGTYTVRIIAEHFKVYEDTHVEVAQGGSVNLKVTLNVAGVEESIAVFPDTSVSQVAEYVGGSLVIRGDALLAMDGPGGLESLLRALALRTSGPFGPVALVDGFADAQPPPTYSIREIRINDNPFSAEYATPGLGRIEILTKPGNEALQASAYGTLGNDSWNSRNPFAQNKVRYESRMYGGNITGPIWPKRAAFFLDLNRQQIDTNAVINATIVDSFANIVPLEQAVVTPQSRTSFAPRLDYQMGKNHTWVFRYGDTRSKAGNSGVGEFSLLSRAENSNSRVRTFQLTETSVLNSKSINETRAQYVRTTTAQYGNNLTPTINVPGAFIGGGADFSVAGNTQNLSELQNVTSWQSEKHIVKFGLQARYTNLADGSTQNFGGTYTFASRVAPQLNSDNKVITDPSGAPMMTSIDTIEAYRRTILFGQQGLSPTAIRQLGGGASQFSITAGQITARTGQYQAGAFIQDNWRLHPDFTLNLGLRAERQSTVSRKMDVAPRAAFAWGIGHGKTAANTVVRGGIGVFYDTIGDNVVLRAHQLDGLSQRQYFTTDNSILDLFPTIATPDLLNLFAVPQSTVQLAGNLRAPYTVNSSLAIERQLLPGFTFALTVSRLRSVHLLRSRDINAPLPGTYDPSSPQRSVRPFGSSAEIFQYESSGVFDQRQLLLNLIYRAGKNFTLWSTYTLSNSKTDAETADTFPANSYDLRSEYSRSASQPKHTFYWGGWIRTKGGIDWTPLVLWRSSVPFNIVTGIDANGDSLFMDRPAFATDLSRPSVKVTSYGAFDLSPLPGQQIIPRNLGNSPSFFIANLRVGKRIPLGKKAAMMLSIQGTNILNHTNHGTPIGNLGSPLFGRSNTSAGDWGFGSNQAGNRRLEGMLYFNF